MYSLFNNIPQYDENDLSILVGGESEGDPDIAFCCWFEHIAANIVWN